MSAKLVGNRLIVTGEDADRIENMAKETGVPKKWLLITAITNYMLRLRAERGTDEKGAQTGEKLSRKNKSLRANKE